MATKPKQKKPILTIAIVDPKTLEYCRDEIHALVAKMAEHSAINKRQDGGDHAG